MGTIRPCSGSSRSTVNPSLAMLSTRFTVSASGGVGGGGGAGGGGEGAAWLRRRSFGRDTLRSPSSCGLGSGKGRGGEEGRIWGWAGYLKKKKKKEKEV